MTKKKNSLLIKNAAYIVTMDANRHIYRNSSIFIEGNTIVEINSKRTGADRIIQAQGKIVLPGFINCHHHMFQCMMRAMPQLQNQRIDRWIQIVSNTTRHMNEEMIYYSALANMAELLLYGCTTTTDMLYIFPRTSHNFFEATIQAARDIGIRFHPYRGSMSLGKKDGALFPVDVVETSERIAQQSEAAIRKFHDPSNNSMLAVGLAPCAIFTNSKEDFKNAALLSKKYNINIQTHLSESSFENEYSMRKFHKRPLAYLRDQGWEGESVSFTHCINVTKTEIKALGKSNTRVVHCPISNARKPIGESGVAPVSDMLAAGVCVGVGVDGSAGNDSSNMLEELRWARIMQGVRKENTYLKPEEVLCMGTTHGARLLNWDSKIGSIKPGKTADVAIFDMDNMESAGACDIPTALLSTQARRAQIVIVNGRIVVNDFRLTSILEEKIVKKIQLFKKVLRN